MAKKEKIIPVSIVEEMQTSYGDYAIMTLVGRAIPDVFDGLKPVTRRILTAMYGLGLKPDGKYVKSARVVGETMGKYHPHGSCYGTMVTNAATHSSNHPLIDGWGNWSSSTDSAASERYTECRLSSLSWNVLLEDMDITEKRPNYDGSLQEPIRLEAKIPVGLLNGQDGIATGYATKIPPHNLRGVCSAISHLVSGDLKSATKSLIPDFPSGCQIVKDEGLLSYLETGRGTISLRAILSNDESLPKKKKNLTFTNIPYGTNTEKIGAQAKKALDEGKLTGILSISDLSDRSGDCLQFIVKDGFEVESLYRHTDLENKFSANSLWIKETVPVELPPLGVVKEWYTWRLGRLLVKFTKEKEGLDARSHILEGVLKALEQIDLVISLIRSAKNKEEARKKLCADISLSEDQANAVLEMRLRQLTSLDSREIKTELKEIRSRVKVLIRLIDSEGERSAYLLKEVSEISERHGNARRSSTVEVSVGLSRQSRTESNKVVSKTTSVRYAKVDKKKGLVEKLKKPRGADLVIKDKDKIIILGANGVFKRLPSNFSGPIFDEPTEVLLATSANTDSKEEYLVVFSTAEGELRKMKVLLSDMMKTTSKGKRMVGEGDTILYFGNGGYTLKRKGRGKDILVGLEATKKCAPGQKGIKIGVTSSFTL